MKKYEHHTVTCQNLEQIPQILDRYSSKGYEFLSSFAAKEEFYYGHTHQMPVKKTVVYLIFRKEVSK